MLIKSLPTFLFTEENVFSHTYNIKSILETLSFKECHLGQQQCSQLLATAFSAGKHRLMAFLKEDLKDIEFSELELPISEEAIPAIAEMLLKFSKPLPFEGLNPNDYPDDPLSIMFLSTRSHEPIIRKSYLIDVQKDWKNWHLKTAEFIYAYLKETHGRFDYFEKFKLNSISPWFFEQIILQKPSKPIEQAELFLHTSIYNKLFLYPETRQNCPIKLISETCEYYLSPELVAYLQENGESLTHLHKNRINKKVGLVLNYDPQHQATTLNFLISWQLFNTEKYPRRIQSSFKEDPLAIYNFSEKFRTVTPPNKIHDFKDKYPMSIRVLNKHAELPRKANELLQNQDIEFTEQDYKGSSIKSSALIEYGCIKRLKEHPESFHDSVECLNWCEENAMSLPDTITITHCFEKPLDIYAEVEGKIWQAYFEFKITCVTKGEVLFALKDDDKLTISYNNLSTKIARNKRYCDYLSLKTYLKSESTDEKPKLISATENLKVSHLKMQGFKEMYLDNPLIGPLKNFIHKHWQYEIIQQHQSLLNFYNMSGIKGKTF